MLLFLDKQKIMDGLWVVGYSYLGTKLWTSE